MTSAALALSALVMGLAGGPHCAAMCGSACGGVVRAGGARAGQAMAIFQAGRLVGYAAAGAASATAVQSFGWLAGQAVALKPVWTLFHLGVLAWGLMLVALARQPLWVSSAGRSVWSRVRPLASSRAGILGAGTLWAFMPCGLLYSALLVASLSGGPAQGALSMSLFALGSGVSLGIAPALFARLRRMGGGARQEWGARIAGALLVMVALWALWMDLSQRIALWCGLD